MTDKEKEKIATAYLRAKAARLKNATPESVAKVEAERAKELDPDPKNKDDAWYFTALPEPPYVAFMQKGEKILGCIVMVGEKGGVVEMSISQ